MKTILSTWLVAICISLSAQDVAIKPVTQDVTAEMNFDPFSGSAISISYLRFRLFTSELTAVRLGFAASLRSEKPLEDVKQSYFEINLRPGFEKHFAGTERLSPYLGFELDLALKKSKYKNSGTSSSGYEGIKGAWSDFGNEQGFARVGGNFLIGTDFYFAKRFYLGTEFGLGVQYIKSSDIELDVFGAGTNPATREGGSSFRIGPNFNSSMRLGFLF